MSSCLGSAPLRDEVLVVERYEDTEFLPNSVVFFLYQLMKALFVDLIMVSAIGHILADLKTLHSIIGFTHSNHSCLLHPFCA